MADDEAVLAGVRDRLPSPAPEFSRVALNAHGVDRAVTAGVNAVTFVMLATEGFNRHNQGCSHEESMWTWHESAKRLRDHGIRSAFMLGASFGCPFTGEVVPGDVPDLVCAALEADADEIALADMIGCGVPPQVADLFGGVRELADREIPMRVHLHNIRNNGCANAFAAVAVGARAPDASIGGIGGCPFAPRAKGSIASKDLAWMFERARIDTSVLDTGNRSRAPARRQWCWRERLDRSRFTFPRRTFRLRRPNPGSETRYGEIR